MPKSLFRFLRGEINGSYLNSIHNTLNCVTKETREFINEFGKMQFAYEAMPEDTVYNIGKFAGVFLPRLTSGEGAFGSMRMTNSKTVAGVERSERGLMNRAEDDFIFHHTAQENYNTDINTLSNIDNKSSMVGNEELLGYISSETNDVVNFDGDIDESKVLLEPPDNAAYSDFYGNNFLYIEDATVRVVKNLDVSLFIPVYEVMQYIRYNGASIDTLCNIIAILCPQGYVKINSIIKDTNSPFINIEYTINDDVHILIKSQRIASMLYVVGLKFPQVIMTEAQ